MAQPFHALELAAFALLSREGLHEGLAFRLALSTVTLQMAIQCSAEKEEPPLSASSPHLERMLQLLDEKQATIGDVPEHYTPDVLQLLAARNTEEAKA